MKNLNHPLTSFKKSIQLLLVTLIVFFQLAYQVDLEARDIQKATERLQRIHSKLNVIHGNMEDEYPEQLMAAMFIPKKAKVLELGANCGRNSLVIASILKSSKNLVSVESSPESVKSLQENRDANGFQFYIEDSAISKVPLIQSGWNTMPSEVDLPGWYRVKTISFKELQAKYQINFDTLVVDCEGALYYILRDEPEMLNNISLIIIENDFNERQQMLEVQDLFIKNGLQCVYNEPFTYEGEICEGCRACGGNFYQVWKKK